MNVFAPDAKSFALLIGRRLHDERSPRRSDLRLHDVPMAIVLIEKVLSFFSVEGVLRSTQFAHVTQSPWSPRGIEASRIARLTLEGNTP